MENQYSEEKSQQKLIDNLQQQIAQLKREKKSAEYRAAELAKVNGIMLRTVNRLSVEPNLDKFLGFLLYEIASELGTDTAVITPYDPSADRLWIAALFSDGKLDVLDPMPSSLPLPNALFLERLFKTNGFCVLDVEEDANLFWPGSIEYLQTRGKSKSVSFAIRLDNQFYGQISLAYETVPNFSIEQTTLVQALSIQAALAIQLTRLADEARQTAIAREQEKAAQERAAELAKANATLRRSLSWLAQEGNLNQFLERVLLEIGATTHADLAYLFVLQEPERMLGLTARVIDGVISDRPTPTEPAIFSAPFSAEITPAFRLMEEQNLFLTLDMAMLQPELKDIMWPDAIDWHLREGRKQVASLVLKAGDRSVGFLGLGFREPREFSQEERELVIALANQASLAILLIQLAEEAKQAAIVREQEKAAQARAAELARSNEALQQTIDILASLNSFDEFIPAVLTIVAQTFNATECAYFEHTQGETVYLRYWFSQGTVLNPTELQLLDPLQHPILLQLVNGFTVPQEHLHGTTVRERTLPVIIDHTTANTVPAFHTFVISQGWELELNQPLLVDGKADGALVIYRTLNHPFTETEIILVEALAKQLALAMQASRLADQARNQAVETALAKLNEVIASEREKAALERVAELVRINDELQQRDQLLSVVAQITQGLLEAENVDIAIPAALQAVGEVTNMSRVLLLLERRNKTTQRLQHCVEFEWVASGILDHAAVNMTVMDNEDFQGLVQSLYEGQSMWRIVNEFPDVTRSYFEHLGIQSTGVVPIFIEGRYIGCIAFDDCVISRHWTQPEIDVLTVAAESIGATLHRQLLVDRLIAERIQAAQDRTAELSKANDVLKQTVDALATEADLDRFLGHVLQAIADQLDAPVTEYWCHFEPGNTARLVLAYDRGKLLTAAEMVGDRRVVGIQIPPEMFGDENLHHRQRHFVVEDLATDPTQLSVFGPLNFDLEAWCSERGVRKLLNVPLRLKEKSIGAFCIYLPSDRILTDQQIELAYALTQQVTLAIQLTRLADEARQAEILREQEKAAQERSAELAKANEVLARASERLVEQPDLSAFLSHIALEAIAQLNADAAMLTILDKQDQVLRAVAHVEQGHIPVSTLAAEMLVNKAEFVKVLLENRKPRYFSLEQEAHLFWEGAIEYHHQRHHKAILGVPLFAGGEFLGHLGLAFTHTEPIKEQGSELLYALAQQAALAIQLTQLAEEAKQAAVASEREKAALERVAQLAQANTTLKKTLDVLATEPKFNNALDHIFQVTIEQLSSSSASLWLYQPDLDQFRLHLVYLDGNIISAIPENVHRLRDIGIDSLNLSRDLRFKEHIYNRTPVIYDVDTHPALSELARQFFKNLNVKIMLGIPLLLGSEVIGSYAIRFTNGREFPPEELELIQALAHQATLAIKLLQMAEEAKHSAILEERNRLAGEIHDTLAQAFTGISIQVGVAKEILERDPFQTQEILDHVSTLAQTGLAEARRSVSALHSSAAEYADLAYNLTHHLKQFKNTTTQVEVIIQGTPSLIQPVIGKNLLRIGQEAVNNAIKHANATIIWVKLIYEEDFLGLEIRDNGCGFELSSERDGFGLTSMTERAERIGGEISITSHLEQGTFIQVHVPIA